MEQLRNLYNQPENMYKKKKKKIQIIILMIETLFAQV